MESVVSCKSYTDVLSDEQLCCDICGSLFWLLRYFASNGQFFIITLLTFFFFVVQEFNFKKFDQYFSSVKQFSTQMSLAQKIISPPSIHSNSIFTWLYKDFWTIKVGVTCPKSTSPFSGVTKIRGSFSDLVKNPQVVISDLVA